MVRALLCATLAFWSLTREKKKLIFFFSFFFVAFFCCCRSQARGPKHHLKRLNAPSHWMLSKLGGIYVSTARSRLPFFFSHVFFFFFFFSFRRRARAPARTSCVSACRLPFLLRNRLKYALNGSEVQKIVKQRLVLVDGKVRTDPTFPAGFMDVVSIPKTNDIFRLLYDVKGRFAIHRIVAAEAKFKLCRVRQLLVGQKGVPYLTTHDGRTIRFPDPAIKVHDTIKIALETGKVGRARQV
jgi:small subunit ribosomal protein S4e